jgi:hypothetical protein
MNPYAIVGASRGTPEAASLSSRLTVWHDAMVAHKRRLRADRSSVCDDDCPHVEARALWTEAVATFGARAYELSFLRSHGMATAELSDGANPEIRDCEAVREAAHRPRGSWPQHQAASTLFLDLQR